MSTNSSNPNEVMEKVQDLKIDDSKPKVDSEEQPEAESDGESATDGAQKKKKKKSKKKKKITAIDNLYPDGVFPEGEWQEYPLDVNSYRTTSEEKRYLDRQQNNHWQDFRKGAEIHRRVRHKAQSSIRPGMNMTEIADLIENSVRSYANNDHTLKAGIGFPNRVIVEPCCGPLHPKCWGQDCVELRRCHESRYWGSCQWSYCRFGLHINV